MSYETIRVDGGGPIATLTLDRPDKMNALNSTVRREVTAAMDDLAADDEARVIVLTGEGEKAFAAGADVAEFAARSPAEQRATYGPRRMFDAVAECPKPTVAAVHGYCLGGGCELAVACDLRVADETARFGQPEIRIGLIPGAGGTQRLPRLVGVGQALRMALTGDFIDAEEAHRIGLVEFLVDEGEHVEKAREVAERMARWSPLTLQLVKEAVRASLETPLKAGLELEKELFMTAFASEDGREGVTAFVEKRDPEYVGR